MVPYYLEFHSEQRSGRIISVAQMVFAIALYTEACILGNMLGFQLEGLN